MFNLFKKQPPVEGIPQKKESLTALWKLVRNMLSNLEFEDVTEKVVNSILSELGYLDLGYRIVVLSLVDEEAGGLRRIALSQTEAAERAKAASTIPFENIVIPFSATSNFCIKALVEKKPLVTNSWPDILTPPLTPEAALTNQKNAGIKTSMVYPVFAVGKPVGCLIFSMIKDYNQVSDDEKDLLSGFADLVGLAVQNSKLVTSLQITSRQLKIANEKLRSVDLLKDEFVSVTSHELRTPMTAIRSYAWMALHRSDVPLSAKLEKYLVRILMSAERLIGLVNDMLNISRIESGKIEIVPEKMDIIALAKDVVDEAYYSKGIEKNIHISVMEEKMPPVFADPAKLRQVVLNLIGNAVKFVPSGGSITVSFFTDGKTVEVSVKDTGVGISKEDLSKLFKKFSRLESSYTAMASSGGTGLGLYISKNLIELMHGKIWASSEGAGKGSTFTFSLPVATAEVLAHASDFKIEAKGEAKGLEPVTV